MKTDNVLVVIIIIFDMVQKQMKYGIYMCIDSRRTEVLDKDVKTTFLFIQQYSEIRT